MSLGALISAAGLGTAGLGLAGLALLGGGSSAGGGAPTSSLASGGASAQTPVSLPEPSSLTDFAIALVLLYLVHLLSRRRSARR